MPAFLHRQAAKSTAPTRASRGFWIARMSPAHSDPIPYAAVDDAGTTASLSNANGTGLHSLDAVLDPDAHSDGLAEPDMRATPLIEPTKPRPMSTLRSQVPGQLLERLFFGHRRHDVLLAEPAYTVQAAVSQRYGSTGSAGSMRTSRSGSIRSTAARAKAATSPPEILTKTLHQTARFASPSMSAAPAVGAQAVVSAHPDRPRITQAGGRLLMFPIRRSPRSCRVSCGSVALTARS